MLRFPLHLLREFQTLLYPRLLKRNITMADKLYIAETPKDISSAKGLHLITQNTPNGQATQILLEELAEKYGTEWGTTVINISTNEQKKE